MQAISVGTYSVEVRPLHSSDPVMLKFENGEHGGNARALVADTMKGLRSCRDCEEDSLLLNVTKLEEKASDIWGTVRRGDYGTAQPIFSRKSFSQTHLQSKDEAQMRPFYFRFHLPHGATRGLMVLQRTGVHGVYTPLRAQLSAAFTARNPKFRLHFNRVVHPEVLAHILSAPMAGYEVLLLSRSADKFDFLGSRGPKSSRAYVSVSAKAHKDQSLYETTPRWLSDVITRKKSIAQVWPDEQVKQFKISLFYKGRRRTFDLTDPEDMALPYVSITEDVAVGADGNPVFESIDEVCCGICDDLKPTLGLEVE